MKVSHPGDAQLDILIGHEYLGVLVWCKTFHSEPPVSPHLDKKAAWLSFPGVDEQPAAERANQDHITGEDI